MRAPASEGPGRAGPGSPPGRARVLAGPALFAIAFGVVEAAVVVYLRHIAYPDGFTFPLRAVPGELLGVELVREFATILMLWGVAHAAARRPLRRFAVFAWCFGVWDLVYYVGLSAFIGWPASLLTWDVLFLIPRPWLAPVLAPCLVAASLILAGAVLLGEPEHGGRAAWIRPRDWAVEAVAGLVVIGSFLWNQPAVLAGRAPDPFPWWLFLSGWLGGLGWFLMRWRSRGGP